jgi:4-oxalocrotonate tautomerase
MPFIQVSMLEGRDDAAKTRLHAALAQAAVETLNAQPETVRVAIYELPAAHWSVGGTPKDGAARKSPATEAIQGES